MTKQSTTSGQSTSESTTTEVTTTEVPDLRPWYEKVDSTVDNIRNLTLEIQEGYLDDYQAERLDVEAGFLEALVAEGEQNTSLVLELSPETIQLVLNTSETVQDATDDVTAEIEEILGNLTTVIIVSVLVSLLFVVILIALVIILIRPWSGGCGRPRKELRPSARDVALDDEFPDATFIQHNVEVYRTYGNAVEMKPV